MDFETDEEKRLSAQLIGHGQTRPITRGDTIYEKGEEPRGLYFVNKGLVGLMKVTPEGVESLLRVFKQGQFFGHRSLFSNEPYHATARALDPCEIVVIDKRPVFEVFDSDPKAYFFLARALAKELRRAENRSVLISEHQMQDRVAAAILLFKKLNPDHLWTRTEIANFCASRTPTVIKTLAKIEELGAIRQVGRRIEIINEDLLLDMIDL